MSVADKILEKLETPGYIDMLYEKVVNKRKRREEMQKK